jgi:hypothetical protein
MPQIRLTDTLFKIHNIFLLDYQVKPLSPSTEVAFFIEKGHVMEVIDLGHKNIVALFFGPNEFVVKCHPISKIAALDDVSGNPFTHGQIINLLRKLPELHHHYRGIRQKYEEKVAARQASLAMSEKARFEEMVKTQMWVLELAKPEDIASYLHISSSLLCELINNSYKTMRKKHN